jgi:hypothetical protein
MHIFFPTRLLDLIDGRILNLDARILKIRSAKNTYIIFHSLTIHTSDKYTTINSNRESFLRISTLYIGIPASQKGKGFTNITFQGSEINQINPLGEAQE